MTSPRSAAFGPLAPYLDDDSVTDVFVNGHRDLWVDRGGGPRREPGWSCPDEQRLREFAVRLVAAGGRHIDEATPCVDVTVTGCRVHVVLPPVAGGGTLVSVRVPQAVFPSLDDLEARGFFGSGGSGSASGLRSAAARRGIVDEAVRRRTNLLITGAAGSGKTTFLSALLGSASPTERIVVIEDVAELRVAHPHVVGLEARQPNLEGAGGIGLAELVRQALRMRPDRLVLGECRGAEIRDLLSALNTGHDGGAGTLHANALADVPARLEALGALAGLDASAVARQAVSAIGLVCHLRRVGDRRELAEFGELCLDQRDRLAVRALGGGRALVVPSVATIESGAAVVPNALRAPDVDSTSVVSGAPGAPGLSGALGAPGLSGGLGTPVAPGAPGAPGVPGGLGAPVGSGALGAPGVPGGLGTPVVSGARGADGASVASSGPSRRARRRAQAA
ncbi:ATPase, T2SS/T4P/T4SS family [Herbiconiux sp. SALV-R1]|uniref:ATPase, T2SS/T4P/T4SS family n=1 Tax=unclassified Herbiconiux TaxID=2618217 RepID=UPI001C0FEF22